MGILVPPEAEQTKHYEYYDGMVQTKLADWMCNLEKCILAEMLAKLNGSWVFWVFFWFESRYRTEQEHFLELWVKKFIRTPKSVPAPRGAWTPDNELNMSSNVKSSKT